MNKTRSKLASVLALSIISTAAVIPTRYAVAQDHWTVTVCRNLTAVPTLTLQAGPGRNDNDVFAEWDRQKPADNFSLPSRVQNLSKIYFQANQAVNGESRMCVKRDGVPKKNIHMTEKGNEHHDIDAGNAENDCGC